MSKFDECDHTALELKVIDLELKLAELKSTEIVDGMKAECIGEVSFTQKELCVDCGHYDDDGVCETCGDDQVVDMDVVIPWVEMKEIYALMHNSKIRLLGD